MHSTHSRSSSVRVELSEEDPRHGWITRTDLSTEFISSSSRFPSGTCMSHALHITVSDWSTSRVARTEGVAWVMWLAFRHVGNPVSHQLRTSRDNGGDSEVYRIQECDVTCDLYVSVATRHINCRWTSVDEYELITYLLTMDRLFTKRKNKQQGMIIWIFAIHNLTNIWLYIAITRQNKFFSVVWMLPVISYSLYRR